MGPRGILRANNIHKGVNNLNAMQYIILVGLDAKREQNGCLLRAPGDYNCMYIYIYIFIFHKV